MLTNRKRTIVALAGLGLVLGALMFCSRYRQEAYAQTGAARQPAAAGQDAEREAVAKTGRSFAAAFEKGDAKAVAAHWTENGEYLSDDGTVIRGRANIEKAYAALFARKKGAAKVEIDVASIRFPSRDSAVEEGHFKVRYGNDPAAVARYSVLHVREDGKWLMAIVREWPSEGMSLQDLDWLIGTWTAKRDDSEITTTYEWWGDKTFIRMDISIKDKNKTTTGFQMIGKNAASGQLRSWTFDADGSFAEASWARDGKKWVLDSAAVLTTGEVVTATNIIAPLDDSTFTFQSVRRTIGGIDVPDIAPVRVTRTTAKSK